MKYDVVILGGGFAGMTLALQLKQSKPEISLLVLEKRSDPAPKAAHKVGESTSELSAFYLREVLNLKDYLTQHQLPKRGFRFFLSPEHVNDIARRVEVGARILNPYPTHQIDRGVFENELVNKLINGGVNIVLGSKVIDIETSGAIHTIRFEKDDQEHRAEGRWIVDSTGRNSFLKRKLNLEKELDHDINSAWFRVGHEIDIDFWSEDIKWRDRVEPGRRHLATNHLMGKGYWIWIIPLISGSTSIGIVADPRYHSFEDFNTFKKAIMWLENHEPLAAKMLEKFTNQLLDFKVMKHFAFDIKQFYSADRWAVTGDAGAFLDPFYSPGTDFIGMGNSWITDLIQRDLMGEDIRMRAMSYDLIHKELFSGWANLYKNMYGVFGNTQVMLMKIVWDWASYWAIPCVLFMNKGYTDISILKQFASSSDNIGKKFTILNERMQELFRMWSSYESGQFEDRYFNVFDLQCLHQFQSELTLRFERDELIQKIQSNLKILEQIASEIFRMVSSHIHGTPEDMSIDPYGMILNDGKSELLKKSNSLGTLNVSDSIKSDIGKFWLQTKI